MTKTEKLVRALIQMGAKEIPSTSRKYRTFTRLDEQAGSYFIGKAGALRTGRCVSNSVSLERFVPELLSKRFPTST
jgi:hypothetical protein